MFLPFVVFRENQACSQSDVCDYFITEGGKRKVETYEAESAESIEFISKEEREKVVFFLIQYNFLLSLQCNPQSLNARHPPRLSLLLPFGFFFFQV